MITVTDGTLSEGIRMQEHILCDSFNMKCENRQNWSVVMAIGERLALGGAVPGARHEGVCGVMGCSIHWPGRWLHRCKHTYEFTKLSS